MSRTPVGETHRSDDGTCTRDFDIEYEEVGVHREQTQNVRSSYIAVGALAVASLGGLVMAGLQSDETRGAQWVLFSMAAGATAVVWGGHTLWVKSQREPDRRITNNVTERVRLDDPTCGQDPVVASVEEEREEPTDTLAEESERECLGPRLAERKLEQLDQLEAEGLIKEARLAKEREEIEAARCPPPPEVEDDEAPTQRSPAERLEQLETLREQGLISDEEYRTKREAILEAL